MGNVSELSLSAKVTAACLLCLALVTQSWAQAGAPNTQPFGSSLKRPKAGANKQPDRKTGPEANGGEDSSPEEVVRVDTSLVLLDILVTDASGKKYIEGLTKDDFIVTEEDRAQEVSFFALGDDARRLPRSIVLIFDRSNSQLAYLKASVEAAKRLVNQLTPADEMAIVTDDVQLAAGFTRDKKRLKSTLDSLQKFTLEGYRTRSMQFSALLATLRELVGAGGMRPIIILQTDGDEVGRLSGWPPVAGEQLHDYGYDMNDVYAEADRSRARIYSVLTNERLLGLPEEEARSRAIQTLEKRSAAVAKKGDMWYGMRRVPPAKTGAANGQVPEAFKDILLAENLSEFRKKTRQRAIETLVQGQVAAARVAELTGGWASFLERPEDADVIYGRILADINRRYVLGYYPSNKALDGRLRRIKIEVRGHPDYVVQGRRSYFALPR